MRSTLGAAPTARIFEVEELVTLVLAGEIRIPEFQRPFRWGIEDARRLFDSIFRGYPLGSLLLWEREAQAARIRVGALEIDARTRDRALWVVDGQQRVTTLANALTLDGAQDERFRLSFNLQTRQFVTDSAADRPLAVSLPVLFDLQQLLQWFKDNPVALDYVDAATGVAKRIRQAKIPASVVDTQDEQVLREIFDRLKSYGKRLTRAEVFSALHPQTDPASPSTGSIEEIADLIERDLDFGAVDGDTVLKAVLARPGPDITREIRREFEDDRRGHGEFPGEDVDTAYAEAHKALDCAVRFLQDRADVPQSPFLPYRHLLIVLVRFFAHHQAPGERQRQLLRRWFWRATGAGPELFPGSTTGTARALCSLVDPSSVDGTLVALLGAIPRKKVDIDLEVAHFRSNYATLRLPPWFSNVLPEGVLRTWIALDPGVSTDRELDLLVQVGADLPGAIRLVPPGHEPVPELVLPDAVAENELRTADRAWRFSLAGVGLKFSVLRDGDRFTCTATGIGGDWIVKLPDPQYPDGPRNEYTMMRLAGAVGIEVPEVALVHRDEIAGLPDSAWRSREEFGYAVRRFDRAGGERLHIEDFAQLAGVYAERKYEGNYETIASLAYRQHDVDALAELVRRLAFFVLIGNGDAHLKNWSLIYRDRRVPTLSPAYDIVATEPYSPRPGEETLALKFAGSRRFESVRFHQFQRLSRRLRADVDLAQVAEDVMRRCVHEWPRFAAELEGVPLLGESVTRTIAARSSSLLGPDRS